MSEMVKRVAIAIGEALMPVAEGGNVPLGDLARAAIAAMREPSEAMMEAARYKDVAEVVYASMIDAALQE